MFYYNFIVFSSTLIITIFPLHESTENYETCSLEAQQYNIKWF